MNQPLDPRTLLVVIGVVQLTLASSFLYPTLSLPEVQGPKSWAISYVMMSLGFVLVGCEGMVGFFFAKIVGNGSIVLATLYLTRGLVRNLRGGSIPIWLVLAAALCFVCFLFFSYIHPLSSARIVLVSAYIGSFALYCGWLLFGYRKIRFRIVIVLTSAAFATAGVLCYVRAVYYFLNPGNHPVLSVRWGGSLFFLLVLLTSIVVTIGFQQILLKLASEKLEDAKKALESLSETDPLTGLKNRRYFFHSATKEFARMNRKQTPVTVLMMDIDKFKNINDSYGHHSGDLTLQAVANICTSCIRQDIDIFCRMGGEEFAAILPDTSLAGGYEVAERLRSLIESHVIEHEGHRITMTTSIGVTQVQADDRNIEATLKRADKLLYRAKANGRNRIESALEL